MVLHIQLLVMSPLKKKKKSSKEMTDNSGFNIIIHLISNLRNDSNNIYKVGVEF